MFPSVMTVGELRRAIEGVSDDERLWTTGYDDGTASLYWGDSWVPIFEGL